MNKATQCARLLAHMKAGNEITSFEAFAKFRTVSLQRRITDIRDMGVKVYGRWIERKGKRYKAYFVKRAA